MKTGTGVIVVAVMMVSAVAASVASGQNASARQAATPRVIVPHESWTCGMPAGIPAPETGTLVFTAELPLERLADIGRTQYGRRQVAVAQQGTLTGAKLSGTVMTGALDFELTLTNGVIEIEQILVLRTSDGKYVYARSAGTGADAKDVRIVMDFEAPNASDVAWLNTGTYVARRVVNPASKTLTLRVYELPASTSPAGQDNIVR